MCPMNMGCVIPPPHTYPCWVYFSICRVSEKEKKKGTGWEVARSDYFYFFGSIIHEKKRKMRRILLTELNRKDGVEK